jgi:hypothetical protein
METLFDPDAIPADPTETPPALSADTVRSSDAGRGTSGGGPMLDDLVAGLWEGLAAHRAVQCPVCASEMRPEYGVHALPIGGRCGGCGSTLR